MRIGILADTHDHLGNLRLAVERFNAERVELVLFAGDLVSTFCVPLLRNLRAPIIACYGDNEGNKPGLEAGFSLVGRLSEPPVAVTATDGTRIVLVHMKRQLRGYGEEFDVAVYAHTHRPRVERDEAGRLWVNPGEASGWSFGRPTAAVLDTSTRTAAIVDLVPNTRAAVSSSRCVPSETEPIDREHRARDSDDNLACAALPPASATSSESDTDSGGGSADRPFAPV